MYICISYLLSFVVFCLIAPSVGWTNIFIVLTLVNKKYCFSVLSPSLSLPPPLSLYMWLTSPFPTHLGTVAKMNKMVKPCKRLQSQGHVKMANRCSKFNLMLVAGLVAKGMKRWLFAFADPLWPCIKAVNVIGTSMSIYGIHISTVMPSLNVILI